MRSIERDDFFAKTENQAKKSIFMKKAPKRDENQVLNVTAINRTKCTEVIE
jgi:hypothetical protein